MLPEYYEFSFPVKIISGHKALNHLPAEIILSGAKRPMIVTDAGVSKAGAVETVLSAFTESGITIAALFERVPPESSSKVVGELAVLYREKNCDCIVAVGGGSVIDTAKGVNILVSLGGDDLHQYSGAESLAGPLKPFFVVPTTAGTGSEATNSAVIIDEEKGKKMLIVSEFLMPRTAFLDTRMTLTLPPKLTAATGMDALSHAMEAYISIQKNPMSDAYAWAAIDMLGKYLRLVCTRPDDRDGRLALANASTMAGTAFSNSMVGCVHSMGHATGAVAHIPHGVAMAVFLPVGLEFNLGRRSELIGQMLLPLVGAEMYAGVAPADRPLRTITEVIRLREDLHQLCGLPRNLQEAGVSVDLREKAAALAINDASALMNPEELALDDARKLFDQAYG